MSEIIIFFSIIIFLIICSAFFSCSETALTAVSEARINEMVTQGNKKAKLIEKILQNREKMISTILISNNFVNVIASVYATSFAITFFQQPSGFSDVHQRLTYQLQVDFNFGRFEHFEPLEQHPSRHPIRDAGDGDDDKTAVHD